MAQFLETAGLPPYLEAVMRPWVVAVETGTPGMREMVTSAATGTAASLKRRVAVPPTLDVAIAQAVLASVALAEALDKRDAKVAGLRADALTALAGVIDRLRAAEPSENTRALGLAW